MTDEVFTNRIVGRWLWLMATIEHENEIPDAAPAPSPGAACSVAANVVPPRRNGEMVGASDSVQAALAPSAELRI
jgi:hypothetical protein